MGERFKDERHHCPICCKLLLRKNDVVHIYKNFLLEVEDQKRHASDLHNEWSRKTAN